MTFVEVPDKSLDYSQLDISVAAVFEVSAVLSLTLVMAMCFCCYRNNQKERNYDNTYLDDLLSKPSLADPESVFSEAGFSLHTKSFYSTSGERSSFLNDSVCHPQVSTYENKETTVSHGTTILNSALTQEQGVEHRRDGFEPEEDSKKFLET